MAGNKSSQSVPSLTRRMVIGGSVAGAVAGLGVVAGGTAEASPTWTDRDKWIGALTPDPIVAVRTGVHPTFERLVLDFAGASGGAWVGYSRVFWGMGNGRPYLVGGNAQILLAVLGRAELGLGPGAVITRADQFQAGGFRVFRDLVFGGTLPDMNWSAFGLGLSARHGFRVFQLGPDQAGHSRLVVDILR